MAEGTVGLYEEGSFRQTAALSMSTLFLDAQHPNNNLDPKMKRLSLKAITLDTLKIHVLSSDLGRIKRRPPSQVCHIQSGLEAFIWNLRERGAFKGWNSAATLMQAAVTAEGLDPQS